MPADNRFFEDMARVATGAAGALSGLRAEVEAMVRQRMEKITADLNLVGREEFEVVEAMTAESRAAQEDLLARFAALEARLSALEAAAKPSDAGGGEVAS
jgi:BMFP domain-containing protein YqiC